MKWINVSDIEINYDREYIGKWKNDFVNSGRFRNDEHGITFRFESGRYVHSDNFHNLTILLKPEDGEPIPLKDLDRGSLFRFGNTIGFKSEYRTDSGAIEAYILGSGEMFWGGTSDPKVQRELMVTPINYV